MNRRPSRGYTLAEMLAVCAVLSVTAVVALPAAAPVAEFRADAAAGEVVLALRFAREEAIRVGDYRVFSCEQAANRIRLYSLKAVGPNFVEVTDPPVLHPGSRTAYAVSLDAVPAGGGMAMADCSFTFADNTTATTVAFNASGNPVRSTGGGPAGLTQALRAGAVRVGSGAAQRTINLDVTGRVTTI
ncbi:prepilin-type N-terminal cleavage/methylation domain-containing protein [Pseudoduganella lurida]|uniref:Prepilin-type N-terminal cleavage/methylation domain-containing protein n=1 Tax=Pseudoduganella lurida TaxID=1036180 RepID=A0A562RLI1_9BURK|nr:prepilin-type N-terminal cleavage/methylation domain-containing protein [Pseudoduganella lurida]TWI69753.1 prepilin-type N-terminal cleavage/methylation domain-containing protein [Pseudoduganella lurida]